MNYLQKLELQTHLSKLLDKDIDIFAGDEHLLYWKCVNDTSIKLHKNHIPLNEQLVIKNQQQYNFNIETLLYLRNQCDLGFDPKWKVTFHYLHPSEDVKPIKETNKLLGWGERIGFTSRYGMWKEVAYYKHWEKRRTMEDQVLRDTAKIKNVILRTLFGIKRLNRPDLYDDYPNLFFFHERGKKRRFYHTHLLLPEPTKYKSDDKYLIKDIFETSIRKRCRSFSRWKKIDVRPCYCKRGSVGYLNKETDQDQISFDFFNSIPITAPQQNYA